MVTLTFQRRFLGLRLRKKGSYRSSPIRDEVKEQANPVWPEQCQALFPDDSRQSDICCE